MERILIIGCPGSGKTRLAKRLGEKWNLPVVHLDNLWWTDDWENVSREEFDARLEEVLEGEKWIIDGNFSRTMPMRLQYCDTIIYLDYHRWQCLLGMFQRVLLNYGKVRPDMGGNNPERFDPEFIKFIWNFNKNNRTLNYTYLANARHAKTIVLKNRRETKEFLERL
ncbi:MAG: topology modulation protein [Faecousia sp.]